MTKATMTTSSSAAEHTPRTALRRLRTLLPLVLLLLSGCDLLWVDDERRCNARSECPSDFICAGATPTAMGVCTSGTGTDGDGDGVAVEEGDCDDNDPAIYNGAEEVCDGKDNDCDPDTTVEGEDVDGDGDGSPVCADCDDEDAANFPGNAEACDGLDNDCDSDTLFDGEATDADQDGARACADCDDLDANRYPGADEQCDGQDNDCDEATFALGGETDEDDDAVLACADCDDADPANFPGNLEVCDGQDNDCSDGADYADASGSELDPDGDTYLGCDDDCDPNNGDVYPGAPEACDNIDRDCDGDLVEEELDTDADGTPDCVDTDDDGDGTADNSDCNPIDMLVYPGAPESCDSVDSDCDGSLVDNFLNTDGDTEPDCIDLDDDGDGVDDLADCAPLDDANFPGNVELCDGQDNDCDVDVDEGFDGDADGVTSCGGDCDDTNPTNFPGNAEVCDGLDNDCNGLADYQDTSGQSELDPDGDGATACGGDCAPTDPTIFPGAPESCDSIDSDCDGSLADEFPDTDGDDEPDCIEVQNDGDGDGFPQSADCDDTDPTIYPNAPELCDGLDQDCDLYIDEDFDVDEDGFTDGAVPDCVNYYTVVLTAGVDCDDTDDQSTTTLDDADCDGTVTPDDCDDNDATSTVVAEDADCDGLVNCEETTLAQGMTLVGVCGGTFDMGCTPAQVLDGNCGPEESPVHSVTLTNDFWMGATEVTQGQWQAAMGNNPAYYSPTGPGAACGSNCPVEYVNWFEALAFTNAVSISEGLAQCFTLIGCVGTAGVDLTCTDVTVNGSTGSVLDCEGYRLPTEAEWEYAARAGTDFVYAGSDTISDVAWFWDYSGGQQLSTTEPVGGLQPNGLGLYDMNGNVQEWAWDIYSASYYSWGPSVDPTGPPIAPGSPTFNDTYRVRRGGSYTQTSDQSRVSTRYNGLYPFDLVENTGFRLARTIAP